VGFFTFEKIFLIRFLFLFSVCCRLACVGSLVHIAWYQLRDGYEHSVSSNVVLVAAVDVDVQVFRNYSASGIGQLRCYNRSGTQKLLHRATFRIHSWFDIPFHLDFHHNSPDGPELEASGLTVDEIRMSSLPNAT
jgi:hypothetical protein